MPLIRRLERQTLGLRLFDRIDLAMLKVDRDDHREDATVLVMFPHLLRRPSDGPAEKTLRRRDAPFRVGPHL